MIIGSILQILDANSNIVFTSYPLPQTGAPTSTTTLEDTVLADGNSNLGFSTYTINIPNQLPIGV